MSDDSRVSIHRLKDFDYAALRARMAQTQIAARGVKDRAVLDAMGRIPREAFVGPDEQAHAYEDGPLPIGEGQTISQPYIVALMLEAAELKSYDKVLEVGAGSGYAAAVAGAIADTVYAIERHAPLAEEARKRLADLRIHNVHILTADGTCGLARHAPFDAILVAAGAPAIPDALLTQLAVGGRLVIPVGTGRCEQRLLRVTRRSDGGYDERDLGAVLFVPLIGEQGWPDDASA